MKNKILYLCYFILLTNWFFFLSTTFAIEQNDPENSKEENGNKIKTVTINSGSYEIIEGNTTKKLLVSFGSGGQNSQITVYLKDDNERRVVLNSWGSGVHFKENHESVYPIIEVSWHHSASENPVTTYKWNGHKYEDIEMIDSRKLNEQALQLFNKRMIHDAISLWERASELAIIPGLGHTGNAEVLNNLGFAYYELYKLRKNLETNSEDEYFNKAVYYLDATTEVDFYRWTAYLNLGDLYFDVGCYKSAVKNYEILLGLKPDYKYKDKIKKRIKSVKNKERDC